MTEKAPQLAVVDELEKEVHSEADRQQLQAWKSEIERERSETLRPLPELGVRPDGSIDTVESIRRDAENGVSGHPYGESGRRG